MINGNYTSEGADRTNNRTRYSGTSKGKGKLHQDQSSNSNAFDHSFIDTMIASSPPLVQTSNQSAEWQQSMSQP